MNDRTPPYTYRQVSGYLNLERANMEVGSKAVAKRLRDCHLTAVFGADLDMDNPRWSIAHLSVCPQIVLKYKSNLGLHLAVEKFYTDEDFARDVIRACFVSPEANHCFDDMRLSGFKLYDPATTANTTALKRLYLAEKAITAAGLRP